MALKEIMAISGYSGLYKFVSQGRNGIIVESMADGKRSHIPASAKVSALSDISVFTNEGEKALREILNSIKEKENSGPTISHKSTNDELKNFFLAVVPNYDTEKVYTSDIKKIVTWYNQLQSLGILDFSEEIAPESDAAEKTDGAVEASVEKVEEKSVSAKKTQPKNPAAKKPAAPKKTVTPKSKGNEGGMKKSPHQKKT
jgi:hypothetical protein